MLEDVLNALKSSVIREVVVVSSDSSVHQVAENLGVSFFSPTRTGLNPAIEETIEWCIRKNAASVLVLPADIPLASSKDIDTIVELGSKEPSVVSAPSRSGGTNALFLNPPNLMRTCFGLDSFMEHIVEALSKGLRILFYYSTGTSIDIDSAQDLKKLIEIENSTRCKQILEQIMVRHKIAFNDFADTLAESDHGVR
jgi:2-phospho-L-lactate guanylyltransferase